MHTAYITCHQPANESEPRGWYRRKLSDVARFSQSIQNLGVIEDLLWQESAFLAQLQPGKLTFPGEQLFLQGKFLLPAFSSAIATL